MFNKNLIILFLLTIFCIGITLSSVSANEDEYNQTQIGSDESLSQLYSDIPTEHEESVIDSPISENKGIIDSSNNNNVRQLKIMQMVGKPNEDCNNPNQISCLVVYGEKNAVIKYELNYVITDSNNNEVYRQSSYNTFESNYNIFRNLPDGLYFCNISADTANHGGTIYIGDSLTWQVNVDTTSIGFKGKDFMISTKDYQKYDSRELIIVPKGTFNSYSIHYKVFDNNHKLKYEYSNHTLKQNINHYLISNYDLFKNLPEGTYTCIFSTTNSLDYEYFLNNANLVWTVTKNTPKKTNIQVPSKKTSSSNHYAKYLKVGKYKVPVWSDDSLSVQKQKVLKYLKKHVKKGKTYKFNGFKFKVSKKQYIQILYKNKFKLGIVKFKINTHKFKTIKKPVWGLAIINLF